MPTIKEWETEIASLTNESLLHLARAAETIDAWGFFIARGAYPEFGAVTQMFRNEIKARFKTCHCGKGKADDSQMPLFIPNRVGYRYLCVYCGGVLE